MKKLIKIAFDNTTRERKTEDSYSELYSYDKNNGLFEFEILNDTLTTEQVTALFKFTESNKIWKTTGTVEGNKVNVTFDTSLITQNETVICYLYFDEEQRTSDTFRFKFKVKVSEIDKMSRYEVKERFINNTVIVDRLDVVTKDELKEALKNVGGIATEGLLTEVKAEELFVKKTDAVDNTNFELVKNRVLALELKTDRDTVYDDREVKERLTTLENKAPVDLSNYATKEELRNVSGSQPLADNLVTKEELEAKHYVTEEELNNKAYLTSHQDLSNYALKSEIPTPYNDSPLNERVTALESKVIEGGAYDDSDLRNRVTTLENKPNVDLTNYVTSEQLENKHYLTQHQSLEEYAKKSELYNDAEVEERLTILENKPNIDTSNFVTNEQLEAKHYLTAHQPLTHLATTSDLEVLRNISVNKAELSKKVDTTEYNTFKDIVVTKTELEGYAKKSELPQPYNDSALVSRVNALESKPTNQYEIHGTGMPNRVVEAPIGTTYIDTAKTNGVLKWIKTTDGWNTGWKVAEGDTGWRTLPLVNKRGNARLQIRRINDEVIVKFDGLQYGWFGVDDMEKQGGNIVNKTIGDKKYTWIKLNIGQGSNILPVGFRSTSSVLTGLYGDLGDLLGSVYVGSTADQNAIQLRYAMEKNEITNTMLAQIRISPITFVTDDPWPTQLP